MKSFLQKYQNLLSTTLSIVLSVFLVAASVSAGSTISTNISTGGTLSVTGAVYATSTAAITGAVTLYSDLSFGNTATTSVSFSNTGTAGPGINFDSGTFVIDPITNRVGIGTSSPRTLLEVASSASTASSTFITAGTIGISSSSPWTALGVIGTTTSTLGEQIGQNGNPITQVLFGTCSVDFGATGTSTPGITTCTATGVSTSDRVFITPYWQEPDNAFRLVSASSSAANTIQLAALLVSTTSQATFTQNPAAYTWSWMAIK